VHLLGKEFHTTVVTQKFAKITILLFQCVCAWICVHGYVCIWCRYAWICVHMCVCVCMHVYMCVDVCVCVNVLERGGRENYQF